MNEMCNNTDTFLPRTGLWQCGGSQGCGSVLYCSPAELSEFSQQFRKLRISCLAAQAGFLPLHVFLSYCELQNRTRELEKWCARTSKSAWHLCSLIYISCFGKVAPADDLHQLIILLNSIVFPQLSHFCSFHFKTRISQVAPFGIKQIITAPFTHPLPVRKVKTLEKSSFHKELLLNCVASLPELTLAFLCHCHCPEQCLGSWLGQQENLLLKNLCVCSLGSCNRLTLSAFRLGRLLATTLSSCTGRGISEQTWKGRED